jgi:hypothetical protein
MFNKLWVIHPIVLNVNAKKTSHQHRSLHSTTQEAASYHIPLKIWDSAPTPLLAIISTTERCVQPTDTWMTSNIYFTRTSHHPNSEFELPTNKGTHHPHMIKGLWYIVRSPIHNHNIMALP